MVQEKFFLLSTIIFSVRFVSMSGNSGNDPIQNGLDNAEALAEAGKREAALQEIERVRRALEEEYNRSREAVPATTNG